MVVLDVQFMKFSGWSCAVPYRCLSYYGVPGKESLLGHGDQDIIRAAGAASYLIRSTVVKEVGRYYTIRDDVQ
eukprot:1153848-Pelagomonas_calceolata.AAC.1